LGRELVTDASPETTDKSYSQVFEEMFPVYLALGMTADQYWHDDCMLARAYREADEIRQRRRNQELWLQGMYVYEAICDCAPLLHAFAKRPKPQPYSSAPYPITPQEVKEKKARDAKAAYEKRKAKVEAWAAHVNGQIKARQEAAKGEVKDTNG
jgi:hypothetical protein